MPPDDPYAELEQGRDPYAELEAPAPEREPEEPPAEASLPGYETRTARALVLPQVDVVGDPSASAEGPSLGSATMREGPGEMRDITVAQKTAPAARVDAASPERSRTEVLRDMVRATMGDRGSMERTSGGAGATRSPLLTRADRELTDATAGSSEGTVGEYQGDRAGITGAVSGATFGFVDEARGLARGGVDGYREERDQARAEMDVAREQNPGLYLAGEAAGSVASGLAAAPLAGAPAATATARIGQAARAGVGFGAVSGFGHSDGADLPEMALDTAGGAVTGGLAGGLAGVGAEAVRGVPQGIARWLERRGELAAEVAPRARLEASGIWGGRAMQAADELPGGQEALAADLRRLQIGERGPGQAGFDPSPAPRGLTVPRPDRAAGDAERVRQAAGSQLEMLAQQADEAGAAVPTQRIIDGAERAAQQLEQLGSETANRAAQRIRAEVGPLAGRPDMAFTDAWRLRRMYDSLADFSGTPGADEALMTAGGAFRDLRQTVAREMDAAMASAAPQARQAWQSASRDYQVGATMRDIGRGAERLSTVGGMGGAVATGMQMVGAGANPLTMAAQVPGAIMQRMGAQESRMLAPGVNARISEAVAERAPLVSQWITQSMRDGGAALGPYAGRFRQAMQRAAPLEAVSTLHYLLSQSDPAYRATIERARQGGDE